MQTRGEYRVGTQFNPSGQDTVGRIKELAAEMLDLIDDIAAPANCSVDRAEEIARARSYASKDIEAGAMWAVKAATKPERK